MNERGRRFSYLSWHNRLKIDKMLKEGYKAQEIADALHVHNSTVYRETGIFRPRRHLRKLARRARSSPLPSASGRYTDTSTRAYS